MIRVRVLIAGLILGLTGVAEAEAGQSMSVIYQQLIENKMQLLADSQNLIEAESNNHIERSILIQKYQICLQLVNQKANFKNCIVPFKNK
jgi:hypothetical protein